MHIPVLLNEVIEYLGPKPGQKFIDATIDGGGHARAVLERISPDGKLLGIEVDGKLLQHLKFEIRNSKFETSTILINDSYVNLKKIAEENNFRGADGILFDLGMSSWHLEEAGRGFSFMKDEPLDMRYGTECQSSNVKCQNYQTAADIVNNYSEEDIANIIYNFGEERYSRGIAREIVAERKRRPITTTFQLVEIIKRGVPFRYRIGRIHFATRTFQALRIAVNHELENVEAGIGQAMEILKSGGRLAVISFHSLEDRIVKNFFRDEAKRGRLKVLTKKPIRAGLVEITANPRARSAKLRVAEKQ